MLDLTIKVENGPVVIGRLQLIGEAARLFDGRRAEVGSGLIYSRYVVQGTRAHMIYPRSKRALSWPGAAHPVRSVRHPGTKPNPFMEEALQAAKPRAEAALAQAAEEVLNGTGGPQTLTQGLWRAGFAVQAEVQARAPVKTGNLRQSYHTEVV